MCWDRVTRSLFRCAARRIANFAPMWIAMDMSPSPASIPSQRPDVHSANSGRMWKRLCIGPMSRRCICFHWHCAPDLGVGVGRSQQSRPAPCHRTVIALDAILISGGVKKTGSLRNIRVQRGGREFVVDLYNTLTASGSALQMRLADGDRILVPPLGPTVAVSGLVRKPGIFELPARASSVAVRNLLALAGGLEVRGRYRLSVLRVAPNGNLQMVPLGGPEWRHRRQRNPQCATWRRSNRQSSNLVRRYLAWRAAIPSPPAPNCPTF